MNANLTKYLSDVFRNEVDGDPTLESQKNNQQAAPPSPDKNTNKFLLDKRFSLRLDEMI
jgi:hypothetical protein